MRVFNPGYIFNCKYIILFIKNIVIYRYEFNGTKKKGNNIGIVV